MDGYWWGVLTPFAIILGILLLYLTGNLFGAIVSWAWKKAHYGLLKKGWIAEDYDEDSREWTTRPGAERLAAALTRSGEYRMLPCFGWMILIVRDPLPELPEPTDPIHPAYAVDRIPCGQAGVRERTDRSTIVPPKMIPSTMTPGLIRAHHHPSTALHHSAEAHPLAAEQPAAGDKKIRH